MNWGSLLKYTLIPVRPKLESLPHLTASTHLHSNTLIRVKVQTTLSVERSRYKNLQRECRFCHLCYDNMIRDVFHFILECSTLQAFRKLFLPKYC